MPDLITSSLLLIITTALMAVATFITLHLFSYTEKSPLIKKKINKANVRIVLTNVIIFSMMSAIAFYYTGDHLMNHIQSLVPENTIPIIASSPPGY
mgnify:CR=1 FL=1|jgi:hypothetical protein